MCVDVGGVEPGPWRAEDEDEDGGMKEAYLMEGGRREGEALQESHPQFPVPLRPTSGISGMHSWGFAEAWKPGRQVHR